MCLHSPRVFRAAWPDSTDGRCVCTHHVCFVLLGLTPQVVVVSVLTASVSCCLTWLHRWSLCLYLPRVFPAAWPDSTDGRCVCTYRECFVMLGLTPQMVVVSVQTQRPSVESGQASRNTRGKYRHNDHLWSQAKQQETLAVSTDTTTICGARSNSRKHSR